MFHFSRYLNSLARFKVHHTRSHPHLGCISFPKKLAWRGQAPSIIIWRSHGHTLLIGSTCRLYIDSFCIVYLSFCEMSRILLISPCSNSVVSHRGSIHYCPRAAVRVAVKIYKRAVKMLAWGRAVVFECWHEAHYCLIWPLLVLCRLRHSKLRNDSFAAMDINCGGCLWLFSFLSQILNCFKHQVVQTQKCGPLRLPDLFNLQL